MIELILALSIVCCGLLLWWLIDVDALQEEERRQAKWGQLDIEGKLNRMRHRRSMDRAQLALARAAQRQAAPFGGQHPTSVRNYPSGFGRILHGGPYDD